MNPILKILSDKIKVVGPRYYGAPYPPFDRLAINEAKIPKNMRLKLWDCAIQGDNILQIRWIAQEPFTQGDFDVFMKEVERCINAIAKAKNCTDPFDVRVYASDRDGGSYATTRITIAPSITNAKNTDDDIYLIVTGIDLLTADEAEKLPENIRYNGDAYWTKTPPYGYGNDMVYVELDVASDPTFVGAYSSYRPVLLIPGLDDLELDYYQELEIFDIDWIYLGDDKVLCKTVIDEDIYDEHSYKYDGSYIQKHLEQWLKDMKRKYPS